MIEKLVLGEIWTGDLPIFNLDALTSAPSWQGKKEMSQLGGCWFAVVYAWYCRDEKNFYSRTSAGTVSTEQVHICCRVVPLASSRGLHARFQPECILDHDIKQNPDVCRLGAIPSADTCCSMMLVTISDRLQPRVNVPDWPIINDPVRTIEHGSKWIKISMYRVSPPLVVTGTRLIQFAGIYRVGWLLLTTDASRSWCQSFPLCLKVDPQCFTQKKILR